MDLVRALKDGKADDYVPLATFDADAHSSFLQDDVTDFTAANGQAIRQTPRSSLHLVKRIAHGCTEAFHSNTGLLLVALSQGFASLMSVFVKMVKEYSDPPVHPLELIWARMILTWVVCIVYMTLTKVPDPILGPKGVRLLLAARGLSGFVGLFGTYYALQYLSLSDATVLAFLTPMTTAIVGALFLKEVLTMKQILASVLSFVGVILIARPEFLFGKRAEDASGAAKIVTPSQRLGAVGVALLGVLGVTGAYTTVRAVGQRAHTMHNIQAFSSVCVLVAPVVMVITRTPVVIPDNLTCLAMVLGVSLAGFGAQMSLTLGLRRETAGRGSLGMYIQIIFALIFERVFFHSSPSPLSIVGMVIILSSAIYVVLSKQSSSASEPSSSKLRSADSPDDTSLEEGLQLLTSTAAIEGFLDKDEIGGSTAKGVLLVPSREKFAILGSEESLCYREHSSQPEPGSSKSISSIDSI